ncbi:MAG: 30S ribosomal protein S4 [Candidatus Falkowbacteria bacterium]
MARYIGPKLKKRQRFGLASEEESIRRRNLRPKRKSDYGLILEEKQKLKFIYGIMEKQMRRYAEEAFASRKDPQLELLRRVEMRLDNVVFRLGLAKTREQARQLVNHGHILVDGKKLDIPSYKMKTGQIISLKEKILKNRVFKEQIESNRKNAEAATFLLFSNDGGRFLDAPNQKELPQNVDMAKVMEFYHKIL